MKSKPVIDFTDKDFVLFIISLGEKKINFCTASINYTYERQGGPLQNKNLSTHINPEYITMSFTEEDPRTFDLLSYINSCFRFSQETKPDHLEFIESISKYFEGSPSEEEMFTDFFISSVCATYFSLKLTTLTEEEIGQPFSPFDISPSPGTFDTHIQEFNQDIHVVSRYSLDIFSYYIDVAMTMGMVSPNMTLLWFSAMLKKHYNRFIIQGVEMPTDETERDRSLLALFMTLNRKCEDMLSEAVKINLKSRHITNDKNIDIDNSELKTEIMRDLDRRFVQYDKRFVEIVDRYRFSIDEINHP